MANQRQEGFVRGLRTCVAMLENMDLDECSIAGVSVLLTRRGRQQDNAVQRTLDQVLKRGDADELDGFCAALTDMVATADEAGDFCRMFSQLADKQVISA